MGEMDCIERSISTTQMSIPALGGQAVLDGFRIGEGRPATRVFEACGRIMP